jgi:hypothetical protein
VGDSSDRFLDEQRSGTAKPFDAYLQGLRSNTSASLFSLLVWSIQESTMAGQSFLSDVNRQFDAAARFVPLQDGLPLYRD